MVSSPGQSKDSRIPVMLNENQWLKQQKQKTEEQFYSSIQDILLEREHNKNFMQSLKFKNKNEELNLIFPLKINGNKNYDAQDLTCAKHYNEQNIYSIYPELRFKNIKKRKQSIDIGLSYNSLSNLRKEKSLETPIKQELLRKSLDLDLKYSIHQAFLIQQNTQQKHLMLKHSQSFATLQRSEQKNYQSHTKKLLPPFPQRLIQIEKSQQQNIEQQLIVPNQLFSKLQQQNQVLNPKPQINQSFVYDIHSILPLDVQLREHISRLQQIMGNLLNTGHNQHFMVSLKANASNIIDQDDINGLTDYIQYAISTESSRMTFIRMFQTKAMSVLFAKWKAKYLKQYLKKALPEIHTIQISKQSFVEWNRVIQRKKLKIIEIQRTQQLKRFYTIFKKWSEWNYQNVQEEKRAIIQFKKKVIFSNWVKYLDTQGDRLLRILRAQSYYKQALMSKGLLCLYQFYLKQIRIRRFQKKICYMKFFKNIWKRKYKQATILKQIVFRLESRAILNERLKYQREFEIKKEVIQVWIERVGDKQRLIKHYKALTHYRNQLIYKAFNSWKKEFAIFKGLSLLHNITMHFRINPCFQKLKYHSNNMLTSQQRFQGYRLSYKKQKIFMTWKEQFMKKKLAAMFYKKLILQNWHNYIQYRNHVLPYKYREQKLKKLFYKTMREELKHKWHDQRQEIILRQLQRKRKERQLKMVFLKLLENILIQKQKRIIESTIVDFRAHSLYERSFSALKRRWLKRIKARLLNRVAKDFYNKIKRRRELRRKEKQEYQGMNNTGREEVQYKQRIFNSWRMYSMDKYRKYTVIEGFLDYKQRQKLQKCLWAWRSVSKYVQSHSTSHRSHSLPFSPQYQQKQIFRNNSNLQQQQYSVSLNTNKSFIEQKYNQVIGQGDITQVMPLPSESPFKIEDKQEKSLFDELETIFQKNQKWLEEQKEREEFLSEMAQHYNQQLSQEMSTLRYSSEKFISITSQKKN